METPIALVVLTCDNYPMHLPLTSSKSSVEIAAHFNRSAQSYDHAAIIQQEVGLRLLERLDLIKCDPAVILDLGCGTGFLSSTLAQRYPKAHIIELDLSEGMLGVAKKNKTSQKHAVCGDAEYLPFKSHSVDFIFSNCVFHWFCNPQNALAEIRRVLNPDGLLLFSTLGPDTLKELRNSIPMTINPFIDMHHIGDMLIQHQLQDPVMDMEMITLTYQHLTGLISDLKNTGEDLILELNMTEKLTTAYEQYRTPDNQLPATFEVIYGHAWASSETLLQQADIDGVIRFPVSDLQIL